jgi:hypothetical protein
MQRVLVGIIALFAVGLRVLPASRSVISNWAKQLTHSDYLKNGTRKKEQDPSVNYTQVLRLLAEAAVDALQHPPSTGQSNVADVFRRNPKPKL